MSHAFKLRPTIPRIHFPSIARPIHPCCASQKEERTRIGVPRNFYFDDVDAETADAVHSVADMLTRAGARLVDQLEALPGTGTRPPSSIATPALHAKALDAGPETSLRLCSSA
jgi:hypothetical protein